MNNNPLISVVVPCYNEQENIPLIIPKLQDVLKGFRCELILIDDGSTDESFNTGLISLKP